LKNDGTRLKVAVLTLLHFKNFHLKFLCISVRSVEENDIYIPSRMAFLKLGFEKCLVGISAGTLPILTEIFHGFSHSFDANAIGIVPQLFLDHFLLNSFQSIICHSII
jgi:hypothetical protein